MSDNPKVIDVNSEAWVEICPANTPVSNVGPNIVFFCVDTALPTYSDHTFSLNPEEKEIPPGTGSIYAKVISADYPGKIGVLS